MTWQKSSKSGPERPGQSGLTLVELMVVLAIVGILMAVASITVRQKTTARDMGYQLASLMRETSRKAVTGGAITPNIATTWAVRARTRIHIETIGGYEMAILQRVRETPAPTWIELERRHLTYQGMDIAGYRESAEFKSETVAPPPSTPYQTLGPGDTLDIECFPDGSCDPVTLYIQSRDGTDRARVALVPLNASPKVYSVW